MGIPPILWWGSAPTVGTGYGTQTKQVIDRLVGHGVKVAVAANYGVQGVESYYFTPSGYPVNMYPAGEPAFSDDALLAPWREFMGEYPDALFLGLADAFVLPALVVQGSPLRLWTPVEHAPCPPDLHYIFSRPESTVRPIAMSHYGQMTLEKAGIEAPYIPHAVEPTFRPTDGGSELMGVPDDAFVVSMIAANKGWSPARKSWGEAMQAFQRLSKSHDDAVLYLHTDMTAPGSLTLHDVVTTLGLTERVFYADQHMYRMFGYTAWDLAAIYTRTDIVLSPSMGEGFGLCPLEAAACGTPSIVSDFSAQPELASSDSYLVQGQLQWHQGRRAFLFVPFVDSIADALHHAYDNPVPRSQAALDLAADYDADTVFNNYWLPYLEAAANGG